MNPLPGAIVVQDDAQHPLLAAITAGAMALLLIVVTINFIGRLVAGRHRK